MTFIEWLESKCACPSALEWVRAQPDQSLEALWRTCPRGDWMLWVHARAGTPAEALAPVAYRAANRAMGYAIAVLDAAGISHSLLELPEIVDEETARKAEAAAGVARVAAWAAAAGAAYWAAAGAADWAAYWAAAAEAAAAAAAAQAWAAEAAEAAGAAGAADWAAEHLLSSNDCRELLPPPSINFD